MNIKSPKAAETILSDKEQEGEATSRTPRSDDFLITAIGASAGGLEAGIDLIRNLDPKTRMAYVFIQHLDPTHSSMMKDLLARETSLPVTEVVDGTKVVPNHVYVIPPNALMTIDGHDLRLGPRDMASAGHMPIDHFMRAMANALGNQAIGVILSGTGSDGVLGMAEIQALGGVTFAQDPTTAKYDGMPRSAIAAGCADYILPPPEIANELARLARHPYASPLRAPADVSPVVQADANGINTVFQLLRRATRVDFAYYRKTTILRRIQRRMVVHKIEKFQDYVKYLQSNPREVKALYEDMLIHVTSFFRDPKVFESLKRDIFPRILKNKDADSNIRIWVPGCASGEEVYSLAITLLESIGPKTANIPVQFFGTDISEASVKSARGGFCPVNIQGDVSPQRMRRFFGKADGGYRINKQIREMCIFAQHNLLIDPPFSRMDLICCRNLLIYFEPVLQARAISLFHYALRPAGYLVLGASEGLSTAGHLFRIEDRENKIFSIKASSGLRQVVTFSLNRTSDNAVNKSDFSGRPVRTDANWNYIESQKDFDRRLLAHHVSPTIFVNEDLEIIHARGKFNQFVKIPPGRPSLNILKMAHDDLMVPLQSALQAAKKEGRPVHRSGISLRLGNGRKSAAAEDISFEVTPLRSGMNELCFMIVFYVEPPSWTHTKLSGGGSKGKPVRDLSKKRIQQVERELSATKEHLQSMMENQEVTNEELQSANEEILSSNEELQSTNEELETAKEELQSTNEELSTVNDELRGRNLQITEARDELKGLLAGVDIAIVGDDSQIRTLTPSQKFIDLLPADISGSILGAKQYSSNPDFEQMVGQALLNAARNDGDYVVDRKGNRYRAGVRPYKTSDGKVEGHIVTLVNSSVVTRLSQKHVSSAAGDADGEPQEEATDK